MCILCKIVYKTIQMSEIEENLFMNFKKNPIVTFTLFCFFILIIIRKDCYSFSVQQVPKESKYEHHTNFIKFEKWLESFSAKDVRFQDFCVNALRTNVGSSQFSQDMWLFNNIFKNYVLQKKKGFYVDSGANDWREFSNTFFFDVCLGWDGLCIEPAKEYHASLKEFRSCTLITDCISDRKHEMSFVSSGAGSHVVDGNGISCNTLASMLGNRSKVDLWSLDVEKHELEVLKTIDFEQIEISVLLVEDFWLPVGHLDVLLLNGQSGFLKLTQFPIDSVFVHKKLIDKISWSGKYWYPDNWQSYIDLNRDFRKAMVKTNQLDC